MPNVHYAPEVEVAYGRLHIQHGALLAELGMEMTIRPEYVRDGVAESAWVAWVRADGSSKDQFYISLGGEVVGL
jgi:hypothetical protein